MSEKNEDLTWKKVKKYNSMGSLPPVLNALLAIVEAEKQRTLEQLDQAKNMLETMAKNKKHE